MELDSKHNKNKGWPKNNEYSETKIVGAVEGKRLVWPQEDGNTNDIIKGGKREKRDICGDKEIAKQKVYK